MVVIIAAKASAEIKGRAICHNIYPTIAIRPKKKTYSTILFISIVYVLYQTHDLS